MRLRDGSAFIDVYGEFVPHAHRSPGRAADPHGLFSAKAIALAINEPNGHDAVKSRWVPSDASTADLFETPGLVAWFQVSVLTGGPPARPLPTQALVECAGDVTARLGRLELHAVRALLPLDRHATAAFALASSLKWFPFGASPRSVICSLDTGDEPFATRKWQQVLDLFQSRRTGGFQLHGQVQAGVERTRRATVVRDEMWLGTGGHEVKLHGSLPEWSFDSVGWMIAQLADCAWESGARESMAIEVAAAPA